MSITSLNFQWRHFAFSALEQYLFSLNSISLALLRTNKHMKNIGKKPFYCFLLISTHYIGRFCRIYQWKIGYFGKKTEFPPKIKRACRYLIIMSPFSLLLRFVSSQFAHCSPNWLHTNKDVSVKLR